MTFFKLETGLPSVLMTTGNLEAMRRWKALIVLCCDFVGFFWRNTPRTIPLTMVWRVFCVMPGVRALRMARPLSFGWIVFALD